MKVGIFGSWRPLEGDPIYELARQVGIVLAERGHQIITGGYSGVMEAASRGAKEGGGVSIGVTCPEIDTLLPHNPWLTQRISASDITERLSTSLRLIDAAVFFPGRAGTVSEIALASELRRKGIIHFPLILIGDYWLSFFRWMETIGSSLPYSQDTEDSVVYRIVNTPKEIADMFGNAA